MDAKTTLKILAVGLNIISAALGLANNWIGAKQQDAKIEEAVAEAVSKAMKGES